MAAVNPPPRFLPQPTKASLERRAALYEFVRSAKSEHPEIVGATIYGSAARGDARETSDIDAYIFVDPTLLAHRPPQSVIRSYGEPALAKPLEKQYRDVIDTHFQAQAAYTTKQTHDIRPLPISRAILQSELDLLKEELDYVAYRKDAYYPSRTLYGLFHQSIAEGLESYRQYVLDALQTLGDDGERMWQNILNSTESMEQHLSTGEATGYARSLEAARNEYLEK